MNHGPLPSRLAFISDLPSLPQGTKVRFLGCVTSYTLSTGTLTLQHAYPPPPHPCAVVKVDANLLLENMKSTDTKIGEWVNVIGYIEWGASKAQGAKNLEEGNGIRKRKPRAEDVVQQGVEVKVQAVMLWSAGAIKLGEYEKHLEDRKRIELENAAEAKELVGSF